MKKKNVIALALGTGYAESSSWAQWIIVHNKGFHTLEQALNSIKTAIETYIVTESSIDKLSIQEVVYEVIHGSMQDHGMLWEYMYNAGWQTTPAWGTLKSLKRIVLVNNAPEVLTDPKGMIINNGEAIPKRLI